MKKKLILVILILIVAILTTYFFVQHNHNIIKAQANPEEDFKKLDTLICDGRLEEAIKLLQKIIRENPGTEYEVAARFELAEIYFIKKDANKMLNEYQTIVSRFPGTTYELNAKSCLIDCNYAKKGMFDTWLQKVNELLVENGAVSVYDIIGSDKKDNDDESLYREDWWGKIKAIDSKIRDTFIPEQYLSIAASLKGNEFERPNDSIKLYVFIRMYFPKYERNWKAIDSINSTFLHKIPNYYTIKLPGDDSPPTIRPIAPRENNEIGDTQPKIEVELTDGDISQQQVDLAKTVFTLDGQDITDKMRVKININKSGQLGPDFEKIRLIYRPETPLSIGKHTVYIKAMDSSEQTAEKTWSFTVKK